MIRYKLLIGKAVKPKHYRSLIQLDNEVFKNNLVSSDFLLKLYRYYPESNIVLWDKKESRVIGYISLYPASDEFVEKYSSPKERFLDAAFNKPTFWGNEQDLNLHIYTMGILEQYRGNKIKLLRSKPSFHLLNEGIVKFLIKLKKDKNISIKKIYIKTISEKSFKYAQALKLDIIGQDKINGKYVFLGTLTDKTFSKCSNNKKLIKCYNF